MMIRLLKIAIIILTLITMGQGQGYASNRKTLPYQLRDVHKEIIKEHKNPEAILSDRSNEVHFTSARPSRFIPGNEPRPQKFNGKQAYYTKFNPINHFLIIGRLSRVRAPYPVHVSSDYYVFALRHILC
ncbi:MAG TPA: hypothetical protein DIS88_03290 [Prevotella sp.]|nr:hypothetical protein [Prevotella sp.]